MFRTVYLLCTEYLVELPRAFSLRLMDLGRRHKDGLNPAASSESRGYESIPDMSKLSLELFWSNLKVLSLKFQQSWLAEEKKIQ